MCYFVIVPGEDGARIETLGKEELEERLAETYWGGMEVVSSMPKEKDPNYWGNKMVIIKGTVVAPVAEEKVTRWRMP